MHLCYLFKISCQKEIVKGCSFQPINAKCSYDNYWVSLTKIVWCLWDYLNEKLCYQSKLHV